MVPVDRSLSSSLPMDSIATRRKLAASTSPNLRPLPPRRVGATGQTSTLAGILFQGRSAQRRSSGSKKTYFRPKPTRLVGVISTIKKFCFQIVNKKTNASSSSCPWESGTFLCTLRKAFMVPSHGSTSKLVAAAGLPRRVFHAPISFFVDKEETAV